MCTRMHTSDCLFQPVYDAVLIMSEVTVVQNSCKILPFGGGGGGGGNALMM